MVLCEANSYGIYIISSDCPTGPADIICNHKNGELYPVGDCEKLTNILRKIARKEIISDPLTIKKSISKFYTTEYLHRILSIFK